MNTRHLLMFANISNICPTFPHVKRPERTHLVANSTVNAAAKFRAVTTFGPFSFLTPTLMNAVRKNKRKYRTAPSPLPPVKANSLYIPSEVCG